MIVAWCCDTCLHVPNSMGKMLLVKCTSLGISFLSEDDCSRPSHIRVMMILGSLSHQNGSLPPPCPCRKIANRSDSKCLCLPALPAGQLRRRPNHCLANAAMPEFSERYGPHTHCCLAADDADAQARHGPLVDLLSWGHQMPERHAERCPLRHGSLTSLINR